MNRKKSFAAELLKAEEALKAFQEKEKIIDAPQEVLAGLTRVGIV